MKNHQKGFIGLILVVVIALAAVGGGAYVYKQKSNEKVVVEEKTSVTEPVVVEKETRKEVVVKAEVKEEVKVISSAIKVCTNTTCFTDAIKSCSSSKFSRSTSGEVIGGSFINSSFSFEVVPNGNSCDLKAVLNSFAIRPSDQLLKDYQSSIKLDSEPSIEDVYKESNRVGQEAVGKSGTCKLSLIKEDIISLFSKNNDFLLIMGADANCSGELFGK